MHQNTERYAKSLDEQDELREYRTQFLIPKQNGKEAIYLCGQSLGLQPKSVKEQIEKELDSWSTNGVRGQFGGTRWISQHREVSNVMAKIVGGKKSEVTTMNGLTINLHLMMISFYRPKQARYKILVEENLFPSDLYAIESQIKLHGFDPKKGIIKLQTRQDENYIRTEDIASKLEKHGKEIALILLGGVNYYTGQVFDIEMIAKYAHKQGCVIGIDLAHAVGNIALELHAWEIDFAVWCTYKYLNCGPGAVGGAFVHENHGKNFNLPRLLGWWGNEEDTRLLMRENIKISEGADGWQVSNHSTFAMAPAKASLKIFEKVGMEKLQKKSKLLTDYLEFLLNSLNLANIKITPPKGMRGCQLSLYINKGGYTLYKNLNEKGVICDWREPNVIRIAPVPLYNSFSDIFAFTQILKELSEVSQ